MASGGPSAPKMTASLSPSARFGPYIRRLQAAAAALGEKVEVPEIVVIGGISDGKSSLVEALIGFRFNDRRGETRTRRPLILQMVHDPDALEPRCQFQEEDSEQYGRPMVGAANIADLIKQRTEAHLREKQAAVSAKPIVMRAAYARCPNLTIIDTPGLVLKATLGVPENTPEEIKKMVKSLASPPNRLILFVQQSSVQWASTIWLDMLKEIDPTFRRTIIVVSKFDIRLKERWEVDKFLSASGVLGNDNHAFFVAIPKDLETISNEEFRKSITNCDIEMLKYLQNSVKGGFNEDKYGPYIGVTRLKNYLESELEKRYEAAVPDTLALLEQRCTKVSMDLERLNSKLQATKDVSQLRKSAGAVFLVDSMVTHLHTLFQGTHDINLATLGKTTAEELMDSGADRWPGITTLVCPRHSDLKLYGGAAFKRVLDELKCAAFAMKHPRVSQEQVAQIEFELDGRGGDSVLSEIVAEIACAAAKSLFAPLIDTACDRLEFVVRSLFDLAVVRDRNKGSQCHIEDMGCNAKCLSIIRCSYYTFVKDLFKQCKQDMRHILCSVTHSNFDLSYSLKKVQENVPPKDQQPMATPTKGNESTEGLETIQSQFTIMSGQHFPTCSSDQAAGIHVGEKRYNGMSIDGRPTMKRQSPMKARICSIHDFYFDKIREFLFQKGVPAELHSRFIKTWEDDLFLALSLELMEANDDKIMDIFAGPGTVDAIQNEHQSLLQCKEALMSCLNEFKDISPVL